MTIDQLVIDLAQRMLTAAQGIMKRRAQYLVDADDLHRKLNGAELQDALQVLANRIIREAMDDLESGLDENVTHLSH